MKVHVLAFGITTEIIGSRNVSLELPKGSSVNDLRHTLLEKYPKLAIETTFQVALNQQMADATSVIQEGDELALIPPVSGG